MDLQSKNKNRPNTYRSQQEQTRRVSVDLSKGSIPDNNLAVDDPFYIVKPTEVVLPLK